MSKFKEMTIKNADMPAMPAEPMGHTGPPYYTDIPSNGLTKREQFCLTMGVPETGDPDLDTIIVKGNRTKRV
jgi:hypothetical protein